MRSRFPGTKGGVAEEALNVGKREWERRGVRTHPTESVCSTKGKQRVNRGRQSFLRGEGSSWFGDKSLPRERKSAAGVARGPSHGKACAVEADLLLRGHSRTGDLIR